MNILAIHNHYRTRGGEDSVFENETSLLRAHGENVLTFTRDNADMEPKDLLSTAVFSDRTYRAVRNLIRANDIDIIHVHNERYLISPSVFKAAADENVPVVRTLHNFRMLCINAMLYRNGKVCRECLKEGGTKKLPALIRGCFRDDRLLTFLNLRVNSFAELRHLYKNVKFIALTDFNKEIFVKAGFDENNIFVKPNFTWGLNDGHSKNDENSHKNEPAKTEKPEKTDFLYLGRIDPAKGIEDILEQWEKLPGDYILNIAGDGEEAFVSSLKEKYENRNMRFLGRLDSKEACEKLRSSKAMIFASRWYEGFPMTIIESFSAGTPVIATDFGNGGDIVKGIYGSDKPLLKDIGELPDRIKSFENDRKKGLYDFKRERLKVYSPEENYRMLMEIYEKCLKSS